MKVNLLVQLAKLKVLVRAGVNVRIVCLVGNGTDSQGLNVQVVDRCIMVVVKYITRSLGNS